MPDDPTPLKEEAGVGDKWYSAVAASLQHTGPPTPIAPSPDSETLQNFLFYLRDHRFTFCLQSMA